MDKKPCNCKAKEKTDNLIKTINEINKTNSVGYSRKYPVWGKFLFKLITATVKCVLLITTIVVLLPLSIFYLFGWRPTIKLPKLKQHNEKQ